MARPDRTGHVTVEGASKVFDGTAAVDDVSLEVRAGEFLTLLGPSGCGKTTLLRMIAGFERPTRGRVLIGGRDVTGDPPEFRPVNMVFQRYALFPHLNVERNVAYGLLARGEDGHAVARKVGAALALVDMAGFAHGPVRQLSGGQQQRVALARALVNEPEVLLLDEPLAALDLQLRKRMQVELRAIHRRLGTTFIYVTHDQGEALAMSDRVAVMNRGIVAQIGTPEETYHRPRSRFVAGFVGEGSFVPCTVRGSVGEDRVVALDGSDRTIQAPASADAPSSGAASLLVRPERASITGTEKGLVVGRVVDLMFTGAVRRYLIAASGTEIKVDLADPGPWRVDDTVGVDWAIDGAVVVGPE
ncbi:MAG: ABC transporter ATP-binding protein [Alphaproteobacteria bacterium]|nr:ABC transporter ATP-binding protein [Alphaproteobacteria bacterium]